MVASRFGPLEWVVRHLRHQLVAYATLDEAFLHADAMDARRASAPYGQLGLRPLKVHRWTKRRLLDR